MELILNRIALFDDSTIGVLHVDGHPVCFTLEDEYREVKVKGETRIPSGKYQIHQRKEMSPLTEKYRRRFDWFDWHLQLVDVPEFEFIYIHVGNYEYQTDGCILVGNGAMIGKTVEWITHSVAAFEPLYKRIRDALNSGDSVHITIRD